MADERGKAIELAVSQIEKQFGKGSIMRLGSKEAIVPISVIPTGSISFDASPRPRSRSVWTGIFRQNDDHPAGNCRSPENGRNGRVRRCRARA